MAKVITVQREAFLHRLEEMQAGLSKKEIVEQSASFCFEDGKIRTFNELAGCVGPSDLPKDVKGAVHAPSLLELLRKLTEDEITLEFTTANLFVGGKRKRSHIVLEKEILLPADAVERPKKEDWTPLHKNFVDAISLVHDCAGSDESKPDLTCVHVTPNCVEACDNAKMARYRLKTGTKKSFLIKRDCLKFFPNLDLTHMAVTENWVHFKGPSKTVLSCRLFVADAYPDLTDNLDVTGEPIVFPKQLADAAELAGMWTKDNEENVVTVRLRPGKVRVEGESVRAGHKEWHAVKYAGKPTKFLVNPILLTELVRKHTDAQISQNHRLKVVAGKMVFVACLEKV